MLKLSGAVRNVENGVGFEEGFGEWREKKTGTMGIGLGLGQGVSFHKLLLIFFLFSLLYYYTVSFLLPLVLSLRCLDV